MDEKGKVLQTLTDCTLCTDLSCDIFMVTVYDCAGCWVATAVTFYNLHPGPSASVPTAAALATPRTAPVTTMDQAAGETTLIICSCDK